MRLEREELKQAEAAEQGFASRVDENRRNHWSELKGQGFLAHWRYFWSYYWIPTAIAACVIIFVAVFIRDLRAQKPAALSAICLNVPMYADVMPGGVNFDLPLEQMFADYAGIDTTKFSVTIDRTSTLSLDNYSEMDLATSQKIFAMIAGADLDCLVADHTIFHNYARNDTLADLRTILSPEVYAAYEAADAISFIDGAEIQAAAAWTEDHPLDPFVWPEDSPVNDPIPVGIRLRPGDAASPAVGVLVNTEHTAAAAAFVQFITAQ